MIPAAATTTPPPITTGRNHASARRARRMRSGASASPRETTGPRLVEPLEVVLDNRRHDGFRRDCRVDVLAVDLGVVALELAREP